MASLIQRKRSWLNIRTRSKYPTFYLKMGIFIYMGTYIYYQEMGRTMGYSLHWCQEIYRTSRGTQTHSQIENTTYNVLCRLTNVICYFLLLLHKAHPIKLWKMFYLLFKHFDPFLNLFPSLYVPSIKKSGDC